MLVVVTAVSSLRKLVLGAMMVANRMATAVIARDQ